MDEGLKATNKLGKVENQLCLKYVMAKGPREREELYNQSGLKFSKIVLFLQLCLAHEIQLKSGWNPIYIQLKSNLNPVEIQFKSSGNPVKIQCKSSWTPVEIL